MQSTNPTRTAAQVKSPCIGVCELDVEGICLGCGRSGEEITVWSRATHALRQEIVERASQRMKRKASGPLGK
ncbi:MAG: DUF1289 domain-containing protein [Pseudomonadota bacterium]